MTTIRDPEASGETTRALLREAREVTHVLLQCMSGLVQDGLAVPGLENAAAPVTASILRAHDACEFNIESTCPACQAARSRQDPCTVVPVAIAAAA